MLGKKMIETRFFICQMIFNGLSDYQIEKQYGHCHKFCAKIRHLLMTDPTQLTKSDGIIGRPKKVSQPMKARVAELTIANRHMTNVEIANLISEESIPVSCELIRYVRHEERFQFLRPIHTFFLSARQKLDRLQFARRELENPRNREAVVFTDESYVWLNEDSRPLWRRRGERSPDVLNETVKFGKKILIIGGFRFGAKLL
jgi:hypothetical protein